MTRRVPHILLVNPWIYDFAAHDLWSKPLGLLLLAGLVRSHGYEVRLLDCLDVHDPRMQGIPGIKPATRRSFGTGKFYRTPVRKPAPLAHVNRRYYRFGISLEIFEERLLEGPRPDAVLLTSAMTYWYPGIQETIRRLREHLPDVPVVLGGTYATLCLDHAVSHSGADHVLPGPGETRILQLLETLTGHKSRKQAEHRDLKTLPWPAFDLLDDLDYVCVLTSRGCPFRCPYCASALLFPGFFQRQPLQVVDELQYWHENHGVVDVAIYDDALLVAAENHILPILTEVRRRGLPLRFHTPNALHVTPLSEQVCEALFTTGFRTIRLGLETADPVRQQQLGAKVSAGAFSRAMVNLSRAGFPPRDIGVYLLCGLPGQDPGEVADSIRMVKAHGARPYLAEFSPIPGTAYWPEAVNCSPFDLAGEPLYQNNSLLPCRGKRFGPEELQWLKNLCTS